jgi:hypothetical protein
MPDDHMASDRLETPGLLRPILVEPAVDPPDSPERQAVVMELDGTAVSTAVTRPPHVGGGVC